MSKQRYTANALKVDVELLNKELEKQGNEFRFVVGGRNGYTAIDLATVEQMKRHVSTRNLECGTPRECLNACYQFMA
jgi:hypothetical protein